MHRYSSTPRPLRRPLLLVALSSFLGVGCSDEGSPPVLAQDAAVPTCTTANCSGCCQGTSCIRVPTNGSCGLGGISCASCAADETCKYGSCEREVILCDATSCRDGCCDNGQCQSGMAGTACGTGGGPCTNCQLLGGICDAATRSCGQQSKSCKDFCPGCCVGESCLAGNAASACGTAAAACVSCANGQLCAGGSCRSTGGGQLYDLILERVNFAAPQLTCVEVECDPQVLVTVGNKRARSSVRAGNDVTFNEKLLEGLSETELLFDLKIDLYDDDAPLGAAWLCSADPNLTLADLNARTLVVNCIYLLTNAAEITFRFEKL